jgi:hypothetical protein
MELQGRMLFPSGRKLVLRFCFHAGTDFGFSRLQRGISDCGEINAGYGGPAIFALG